MKNFLLVLICVHNLIHSNFFVLTLVQVASISPLSFPLYFTFFSFFFLTFTLFFLSLGPFLLLFDFSPGWSHNVSYLEMMQICFCSFTFTLRENKINTPFLHSSLEIFFLSLPFFIKIISTILKSERKKILKTGKKRKKRKETEKWTIRIFL